jgi:glycosyltransferase involved in cell wall biosynthesis
VKVTMVIPSYWARPREVGWKEGDAVYDHPAPLDREGTLGRAIQSVSTLEDRDFRLVVLAAPTSEDLATQVEKKVADIIGSASSDMKVKALPFGPSQLKQVHELLGRYGKKEYLDILKLRGYSNVRNLCMFVPHILGSDIAVLIDDDEVFEDPDFMSKAKEFAGQEIGGRCVSAVAGFYLQPDGDYHVKREFRPWMKYWNQYESMNEAFDKIIGTQPRLKETPFVFGGNMIIHRNLFTKVPFDPKVPRGEDIDFLINARMFGFSFFLDNQLSIRHLPPPKTHSVWKSLREDIYRFVYQRAKIESQQEMRGMTKVDPEEFDPYPGCFLKRDLVQKIEKSCKLLSDEYLAQGDKNGSEEALKNIELAKTEAVPKFDPFQNLCKLQKCWQELIEFTCEGEISSGIKGIIEASGK